MKHLFQKLNQIPSLEQSKVAVLSFNQLFFKIEKLGLLAKDINCLDFYLVENAVRDRRLSFLMGRIASYVLFGSSIQIVYSKAGAPKNKHTNQRFSISHKDHLAAALHANGQKLVGVDIEKIEKSILSLKNIILTKKENLIFNETELTDINLTIYFSFKESIYKAISDYVGKVLEFNEIEIEVDFERCKIIEINSKKQIPKLIDSSFCIHDKYVITQVIFL